MPDPKRNRPAVAREAAPRSMAADTWQGTSPLTFDLEALTAAVASLNRQRLEHGCTCQAGATFLLLPDEWFRCGTTHDEACPAVGGAR